MRDGLSLRHVVWVVMQRERCVTTHKTASKESYRLEEKSLWASESGDGPGDK